MILSIETSSDICSVCIADDEKLIDIIESSENRSHASHLSVFIDRMMKKSNIPYSELKAVAVSMGPGSYTGLRIGVSMAKGLCYGLNIPLISVNTLYSLALGFKERNKNLQKNSLLIPMIDARRMEVYTCIYDENLLPKTEISAEIIDENSFSDYSANNMLYFFGPGAPKCSSVIRNENVNFIEDIFPCSQFIANEANRKFNLKEFEDVAYFEPFYLKDFIAKKPKNKFF